MPSSRRIDMINGPISKAVPLFALPVAATAILEQLFNASDIAVVGNFTGAQKTAAVAAVGANSAIIALVVNLFVGIALGANVVIANAAGRKMMSLCGRQFILQLSFQFWLESLLAFSARFSLPPFFGF